MKTGMADHGHSRTPLSETLPVRIPDEPYSVAVWSAHAPHSSVEHLVEYILTGHAAEGADPETAALAQQALLYDMSSVRLVVIGGGTGLSTIVGGNSYLASWPDHPDVGLKREFPCLTSIVCTTDDGGSTGVLLQQLPMIAVGDLRKLILSSIQTQKLQKTYGVSAKKAATLLRVIHAVFNHRVSRGPSRLRELRDPLRVVPENIRSACPERLAVALRELGTYLAPGGAGPTIAPERHALGNLFLTAAIFQELRGQETRRREKCCDICRSPGLGEIQRGIDYIASLIGAPVGSIHAATASPGQLKFRYANGIEVFGQSKSSQYRRSSPVDRVTAVYTLQPEVSAAVQRALRAADVIVYAPGSLYSSILPALQIGPIVAAIRANSRALKILAANAWIQEGETDISLKNEGRGFMVSELIEACDRNIQGGLDGLLDVALCANLEHIPGSILRNYALEGKYPIYLDKAGVEALGLRPVEATLFFHEHQSRTRIIQHDPQRFALAVRALCYADRQLRDEKDYVLRALPFRHTHTSRNQEVVQPPKHEPRPFLCQYLHDIRLALSHKKYQPEMMKDFLLRTAWEHRDIRPEHLAFCKGVRVLTAGEWQRSTEWDNVLGYFDPDDRCLKLHQSLLSNQKRLQEDLLIALGESLLGRYIASRKWLPQPGARCYEIRLRSVAERGCYLSEAQLHTYLRLAGMIPDPNDDSIYRITINENSVFFPSGLLFGLLYSWYLTGSGQAMEYEMTLLRWPLRSLNPVHARDRIRKEALVQFFRTEIFGHRDD